MIPIYLVIATRNTNCGAASPLVYLGYVLFVYKPSLLFVQAPLEISLAYKVLGRSLKQDFMRNARASIARAGDGPQ